MALIKCSECGKKISDEARTCPNCACPVEKSESNIISTLRKPKKTNNLNILLKYRTILSVLSIVFTIISLVLTNKLELDAINIKQVLILLFVFLIQIVLIFVMNKKWKNKMSFFVLLFIIVLPTIIIGILIGKMENWHYLNTRDEILNIELTLSPTGSCNFYYSFENYEIKYRQYITAYRAPDCTWTKDDYLYTININNDEINKIECKTRKNNTELHCSSNGYLRWRVLKK